MYCMNLTIEHFHARHNSILFTVEPCCLINGYPEFLTKWNLIIFFGYAFQTFPLAGVNCIKIVIKFLMI